MKNSDNAPSKKSISLPTVISIISLCLIIALIVYVFIWRDKKAYVNTGIIMEKYQGMIDARKKYEEQSHVWQANIDTMGSEMQASLQKYEKEQAGMSARERSMAEDLLKNKQQQMVQYQQALKGQAQQEQSKLSDGAIKQINAYLERYGKDNHYTIIFGTTSGNIVYADKSIDLTDVVLEGLNKEYSGKK